MSKRKKPINNTDIPQHQIEAIARCILPDILAFYESKEGQREFAEWKKRREAEQEQLTQPGRAQSSSDAPALSLPVSFFEALSVWRSACASLRFGSGCSQISQRKPIIRTPLLSEKGSDYMGLVREAGLELWASRIDQLYPVTENHCGSRLHSICSCYFLLNGTHLY